VPRISHQNLADVYAEIAAWLTEQLAKELAGKKIRRGQVYRVYQQWIKQEEDSKLGGNPFSVFDYVKHLTDERAEAEAEIADKKPPESTEEKKS
jgi:hypothetical protein